ncbi:MAG: hypothetical protein ACTXOO_03320 [Sodalis sp. (in: enterobacteria)]
MRNKPAAWPLTAGIADCCVFTLVKVTGNMRICLPPLLYLAGPAWYQLFNAL